MIRLTLVTILLLDSPNALTTSKGHIPYREVIFGSRSGSDRYKIQDDKQLVSLLA